MITIATVVVTRNRPALLKRCLDAIDSQTYRVSELIVVDNASDQPTCDLLAAEAARRGAEFHVIRLEENSGGAGGFHAGMQASLELSCTHMWLMDDDCEPEPQATAELIAAATIVGEDAVLGSNIFDLNGESINVQPVSQRVGTNRLPQYPLYLADGLLEMTALTFVSFLVPVELVRKVGLPLKEFFIWGDDYEYSLRLGRLTKLYQVGKSKVKHLKSGDASQRIFVEESPQKIAQYRWLYRNILFVNLKYSGFISMDTIQFFYRSFRDMTLCIKSGKHGMAKCRTILSGLSSGVAFALSTPNKEQLGLSDRHSTAISQPHPVPINGSAAAQKK